MVNFINLMSPHRLYILLKFNKVGKILQNQTTLNKKQNKFALLFFVNLAVAKK